ncbi:Uncharacterised protein [Mycobacteroides abscessus subsp. abscessus]|uniref:VOC family protein n=1 Tax=Mycobacteroides abscessus TaxID=36809 RepID=UPI0009A8BC70|nr:hypothetical protein [Mycobacteroides abscessus]SKM40121.1 Uncharacterised protein [Mycobacteroides abscessus subsp. abscessus]
MIRRLSLFYAARDLPRARALFTAALDVTFSTERHLEQAKYLTAKLPDGAVLELWPVSARSVTGAQLEFTVPDPDAAAERLSAARFEVRRLSGTALVTDPAGNTVALTAEGPKENR